MPAKGRAEQEDKDKKDSKDKKGGDDDDDEEEEAPSAKKPKLITDVLSEELYNLKSCHSITPCCKKSYEISTKSIDKL